MSTALKTAFALALFSDVERHQLGDDEIEIIGSESIRGKLRAGADAKEHRATVIEAINKGSHVELAAKITGYTQKDGQPNRKFLRIAPPALDGFAKSFAGKPFLVDHKVREQSARHGTITSGELSFDAGRQRHAIKFGTHVVTPAGVIGVLSGTMDAFSISWNKGAGAVLCTAHKTNILSRDRCSCWPGSMVEGLDGAKQVAEYEFQTPDGDELSSVNVPAAFGTKVDDARPALAAALGIELEIPERKDPAPMRFSALAAALSIVIPAGVTELDEAVALSSVAKLKQERDDAVAELGVYKKAAKITSAALVDGEIKKAYVEGKLKATQDADGNRVPSPREERLRRIGKEENGLESLRAEIKEMPVILPLKKRALQDDGGDVRERPALSGGTAALELAAAQLGQKPEDLIKHAREMGMLDAEDETEEDEGQER